jgi:hypothetical protein
VPGLRGWLVGKQRVQRGQVSADGRWPVSVAVEDVSPAGPIQSPAPQEAPLLRLELDVHRAAAVEITGRLLVPTDTRVSRSFEAHDSPRRGKVAALDTGCGIARA